MEKKKEKSSTTISASTQLPEPYLPLCVLFLFLFFLFHHHPPVSLLHILRVISIDKCSIFLSFVNTQEDSFMPKGFNVGGGWGEKVVVC